MSVPSLLDRSSPAPFACHAATSDEVGRGSGHVDVLGLRLDRLTLPAAIGALCRRLETGTGASVFFVNAHSCNLAGTDPGFRRLANQADFLLNDGKGVALAARLAGRPFADNLVGTDLVPRFLEEGRPSRVFLLGGNRETNRRARRFVRAAYPHIERVEGRSGFYTPSEQAAIIERIRAFRPQVLLVGMGQPRQERLIATIRQHVPSAICFGVGGLFDYWAGNLRRAPGWVRRIALEWFYIMLHQPRKVRRYLPGIPRFLGSIGRSWLAERSARRRYALKWVARRLAHAVSWGSLYVPIRRRLSRPSVRVLTYHRIADRVDDPFAVRPEAFRRQMAWIGRRKCALSADRLTAWLDGREELQPGEHVVVAFDDGYRDFLEEAYPVLEKLGIPCVLFLNSRHLADGDVVSRDHLSAADLESLSPRIVAIGGHGHSHALLAGLDDRRLRHEIETCQAELTRIRGCATKLFAYPFGTRGSFDQRADPVLAASGFRFAFTAIHGPVGRGTPRTRLPRVKVERGDALWMVRSAILGGMDSWRLVDRFFAGWQATSRPAGRDV